MIHRFIIIFFLFVSGFVYGETWIGKSPEGFSVQIATSATKIDLNDQIMVSVDLSYPKSYQVDLNLMKSNLLKGLEPINHSFLLVSEKDTSTESKDPKSVSRQVRYTLEPLQSGTYGLSFLNIVFTPKDSGGKSVEIFTKVFEIQVLPALKSYPPLPSARPLPLSLQPPMKLSEENRERFFNEDAARNVQLFQEKEFPWKILLAIFLVAIAAILSNKKIAENKKRREMALILNPRERALKSIQRADQEDLSKISPEEFFIKLSDTVREYIEEEYQLKAPNYTTQEFLQKATQSTSFSEPNKKLLTNFLTKADLVKFAKYEPTNNDLQKAQEAATEFIESTGQS